MTSKSFLIASALTLASLGIASAKTYDITLASPAKAGDTELKAGEYRLKVEGSQAVFTNVDNQKSVSVPVKIEHAGQKFGQTAVETQNKDGVDSIQNIMLGGSDTKVELGQ